MSDRSGAAVFIDVENIHYSSLNNYAETPDWGKIIESCSAYCNRLLSIQAFGDWLNFSSELPEIQRNGIQPVFVPLSQDGKSSLDCYLTVSAMKLFFQNPRLDTIILASGDRDYIPLLAELKAMGIRIIILALPDTLSRDLTRLADDVIPYHKPGKENEQQASRDLSDDQEIVLQTLKSLEQYAYQGRWVNLATLGVELKHRDAQFSHRHHGYRKLVEMLEDIPEIELNYDDHEKTLAMARTVAGMVEHQPTPVQYGEIINLHDNYGFIAPDEGDENIFFHISKVKEEYVHALKPGDRVSFSCYRTHRGNNAENVSLVSAASTADDAVAESGV